MLSFERKIFRQKSAEDIINVAYTDGPFCTSISWRPVIEPNFGQERFLTEDPNDSFRDGRFPNIPVIAGITANEFADRTIGNFFVVSNRIFIYFF